MNSEKSEFYMLEICIIGSSEPMISMVLDNFESKSCFPKINILNNLGRNIDISGFNNKFEISIVEELRNHQYSFPFVLGVNKPNNKLSIIRSLNLKKESFLNLIHNTSSISSTTNLSGGVVVNSLVSIAANTSIHEFATINRNVSIGHDTIIESYSTINPGANIAGFVKIGMGTSIGMGTNIIDHITIGKNSIIGAGSLVTKDIPDGVIAYGNPCKIIRDNEIQFL